MELSSPVFLTNILKYRLDRQSSVKKVMLCCGAEIDLKHYQCEQKSYPSYNLQRSLLI